ncbi:LysR family transcriptional regulator [Halomonas desiderata]|nr:LysR family transcriptional regulator [Halomonas desiderata]
MERIRHLRAMEVFDKVAEHSSFSKAADVLNITHGAVSRQIKLLEESLNTSLFYRGSKGVELTVAGEHLYESTRHAFSVLRNGVYEVNRRNNSKSLKVSLPNAVALKWLVPQLSSFRALYPDVALLLETDDKVTDFGMSEVDLALRFGTPNWSGLYFEKIADEELIAVASPRLVENVKRPMSPEEIIRFPLLRDAYNQGWEKWADLAGINPARLRVHSIQYFESAVLLEAAIDQQGVALARRILVERDIEAGRLLHLDEISVALNRGLYFVCRFGDQNRPVVNAFKEWLLANR